MPTISYNQRFCEESSSFLEQPRGSSIAHLIRLLDGTANDLAQNEELRHEMGQGQPSLWPLLQQLWEFLSQRVFSESEKEGQRALALSVARFTRNIVANVPSNQVHAFGSEPFIRKLIHCATSWSVMQDSSSFVCTRMMVQAMSNLVTANERLLNAIWGTYTSLPDEQSILVRLLACPDAKIILSVLVFIMNCVHEDQQRCAALIRTPGGARVCILILDRMVDLYDADENSEWARAFDYGYHLFAHLFNNGFASELYTRLSVADEIISPHQTVLLKLLDSHLQSSHPYSIHKELCATLTSTFFELSTYTRRSIARALGRPSSPSGSEDNHVPRELDVLLPKACEALVLISQCLATIVLHAEEIRTDNISNEDPQRDISSFRDTSGQYVVESLVELLRCLDAFLPRINFGKPVNSPYGGPQLPAAADPSGFVYLKRDLVRLLSSLCHNDRKTQDLVRMCGGIPVVMSMCVIDERNPYLREHAILALRNLTADNEENQRAVNEIKPVQTAT